MQDYLNSTSDNEIDLRELFIVLWAHKILIISTCVLGIISGIYYVQSTDKIFTSTATFKLDQENSMGFSFGSNDNFSPLASLAALGGVGNTSGLPLDKVAGRIFIQKIDAELNFQSDPYFNTYNPNQVDPIWKSLIKRTIGWPKTSTNAKTSNNAQEAIWQSIVRKYSKNIILKETKEASAEVTVTHVNPDRAAEIANVVMNTIISDAKTERREKQEKQLFYLSNTLAKALGDLELAQNNLKEFSLKNSTQPLENFVTGSFALDELREQLKSTTKLHSAVAGLSLVLQNKTVNEDDYQELRQKFPIVDKVEFRRILGQNEVINAWSWPEASSVDAVFDTLSDRITRLQSDISSSQKTAIRSSTALETYARLERDAKIAEATYTVLIEQVKAQSVVAGYQPDNTEVYEIASPSIGPSSPKRSQILPLGALVGLFVGIALSFALAYLRGVCYSRKSLKNTALARLTFSNRTLLNLRNKSLNDLKRKIGKKPHPILRDMAVAIHKNDTTQVVVTSSLSKLSGADTARGLVTYMQSDTTKIAVIDFSSRAKMLENDYERLSLGSFIVSETEGHVSVLRPDGDTAAVDLLAQKGFRETIQSLNSTFDLVFLCADNGYAMSLLSALEGQKAFHITLARIRKTKSFTLTQMRSHLPIQGLIYD